DVLLGDVHLGGQLGDGRRAAEVLAEVGDEPVQLRAAFLVEAGHPDGPGAVAEVAFDLAGHGDDGVAPEGVAEGGVEAVDGLHEPDVRGLEEVFQRLAAVAVAPGDLHGERPVQLHDALAEPFPESVGGAFPDHLGQELFGGHLFEDEFLHSHRCSSYGVAGGLWRWEKPTQRHASLYVRDESPLLDFGHQYPPHPKKYSSLLE